MSNWLLQNFDMRMSVDAQVVTPAPRASGEAAYEALKSEIVLCGLAPGEEVSEAKLEKRFGFNRAAIRKALTRLTQENLIKPVGRIGHQVAPLSLADIHDVFLLRRQLEPFAARLAAGRVDEKALRELDQACQAGYVPGDRAGEVGFLEANRCFHIGIARASGSPRLAACLEQLHNETTRILYLGFRLKNRSTEWVHGHEALLDALVLPDADAAERIAAELLENSADQVTRAALGSPRILNLQLM
jgi:DNA-binding GntR family transcriptional regulator